MSDVIINLPPSFRRSAHQILNAFEIEVSIEQALGDAYKAGLLAGRSQMRDEFEADALHAARPRMVEEMSFAIPPTTPCTEVPLVTPGILSGIVNCEANQ